MRGYANHHIPRNIPIANLKTLRGSYPLCARGNSRMQTQGLINECVKDLGSGELLLR
jgi:hypothetical protein